MTPRQISAPARKTDFHQFMLYTPVPGTPLYREMQEKQLLLDVDLADIHGQHKFNFKHSAISRDDSNHFLDWAFWRDFQRTARMIRRRSRTIAPAGDCDDCRRTGWISA